MDSSMARVTFSPTTAPMVPPIKPNSIAHITTGRPLSWPSAVMMASFMPSFLRASLSRCARLGVHELQRVGGSHTLIVFCPAAVEQHFQARARAHLKMKLALRADVEGGFEVLAKDDRAAGLALDPQPFGTHTALFGRCGLLD